MGQELSSAMAELTAAVAPGAGLGRPWLRRPIEFDDAALGRNPALTGWSWSRGGQTAFRPEI